MNVVELQHHSNLNLLLKSCDDFCKTSNTNLYLKDFFAIEMKGMTSSTFSFYKFCKFKIENKPYSVKREVCIFFIIACNFFQHYFEISLAKSCLSYSISISYEIYHGAFQWHPAAADAVYTNCVQCFDFMCRTAFVYGIYKSWLVILLNSNFFFSYPVFNFGCVFVSFSSPRLS